MVTTTPVLGETWTLLRRRMNHAAAVGFLDILERLPHLDVVRVGEAAEHDAWRWLRRHGERPYSFVDATSFVVMRGRRIREALAFDGDFTAAGFVEVRAGRRMAPDAGSLRCLRARAECQQFSR